MAPALACEGTDLEAADIVRAPRAGIIAYRAALGSRITKGDVIGELVDPLADDPGNARLEIRARSDGLVLSRCLKKLVAPGDGVAMIVGTQRLAHRKGSGSLLSD
jgi:hypothetical protein